MENTPQMKNHTLAIIIVLVVLLGLEITMRATERLFSGNIDHIYSIAEIVRNTASTDKEGQIVFVGNSLIKEAVDPVYIEKALQEKYHISTITPDGTSIWDWYYIIKNQLFEKDTAPDYIIIGFAWELLSTRFEAQPERLGAYFAGVGDLLELYQFGMKDFSEICRFFLGKTSHLFVNREAVRNKVLGSLIPGYKLYVRQANATAPREQAPATRNNSIDYQILHSLLNLAEAHSTRLIFIAMPVQAHYSVATTLSDDILGDAFLDFREILPDAASMYKDDIHLNSTGKSYFSAKLSAFLHPVSNDS
jgi:hypothetical protein